MHRFIAIAHVQVAAPQFSRAEVLLALLVGLVVAFATARPAVLDDGSHGPRTTACMRLGMAALVIAAGGVVFLVLRGGLGSKTQLGTPDTQYVFAGGAMLGVFAAALHLEPLLFRWPLAWERQSNAEKWRSVIARACAVVGPLFAGGAVVLLVAAAGLRGRTFDHFAEKLPWLLGFGIALAAGFFISRIYVRRYVEVHRSNEGC